MSGLNESMIVRDRPAESKTFMRVALAFGIAIIGLLLLRRQRENIASFKAKEFASMNARLEDAIGHGEEGPRTPEPEHADASHDTVGR